MYLACMRSTQYCESALKSNSSIIHTHLNGSLLLHSSVEGNIAMTNYQAITTNKPTKLFGHFNAEILARRNIIQNKTSANEITDDDLSLLFSQLKNKLLPQSVVDREAFAQMIYQQKIVIGTSLLTNITDDTKPLNACTVIDLKGSPKTWIEKIKTPAEKGMGTGFCLDDTDNPASALDDLNKILASINTENGRPVAGITNLSVHHVEVIDYIKSKRDVDFNKHKLNISVTVDNDYMDNICNNRSTMLDNEKFSEIVKSMHYCGEPGLILMDNIEATNPVPHIKYVSVAPCAEIAMSAGDACQFGHVNLSKTLSLDAKGNTVVDWLSIKNAVKLLTRALDTAVSISIENAIFVSDVQQGKRRIGIGICGYADFLIELDLVYGSTEGNNLLEKILTLINFESKKESCQLAKDKGSFNYFKQSRYFTETGFVTRFSNAGDIAASEWLQLENDIKQYGLRNSSTTALPPTGNSALLVGTSNSIEPHFSCIDRFSGQPVTVIHKLLNRNGYSEAQQMEILAVIDARGSCQHAPHLSVYDKKVLRTANEIRPQEHIAVVKCAQPCIDDSVSKTINVDNLTSEKEVADIITGAYQAGLKGITVFRDGCLSERKA